MDAAATVGTTLGVTGAATHSSTSHFVGAVTMDAAATVGTTLGVTGAVTLTVPLASTSGGTGSSLSIILGDLIVGSGAGTTARLAVGSANQALIVSGGTAAWAAIPNSIAGTANQITASAATGAVTLSLPSAVTLPGSLALTGKISTYNNIATAGGGVPATYATTSTSPVVLVGATTILTYTPAAAGLFMVLVSVEASTATTLNSLTVTYTDQTSNAVTTQTLATSVVIGLNAAFTYCVLCSAKTSTAISVQGTPLVDSRLYASATISAV